MAKITIVGGAIVITSSQSLEDIKYLEKNNSKALCLYEKDENGKMEEIFKVASTDGKGSINKYGASFSGETHDEAKLATITLCIPEGTKDVVEYAAEKYGKAVKLLNKVEEQFSNAKTEIAAEKEEVRGFITVV